MIRLFRQDFSRSYECAKWAPKTPSNKQVLGSWNNPPFRRDLTILINTSNFIIYKIILIKISESH